MKSFLISIYFYHLICSTLIKADDILTRIPRQSPSPSLSSSCFPPLPTREDARVYRNQLGRYLSNIFAAQDDVFKDPKYLVTKYGYSFEEHIVHTDNGYILKIHRIPKGKLDSPDECTERPVVILSHGFLCSSLEWLHLPPDKVLAYQLSDRCYDIWLMNYRGNRFSRGHLNLKMRNKFNYWNFGIDQLAKYDIPALFEYIKKVTGQQKYIYVGHSMGASTLFACLSSLPKYNDWIKLFVAFAPPISFTLIPSVAMQVLAGILGYRGVQETALLLGQGEFLSNRTFGWFRELYAPYSELKLHARYVTAPIIATIVGYNWRQIDQNYYPIQVATFPDSASTGVLVNYMQIHNCQYLKDNSTCKPKFCFKGLATIKNPCPEEWDLSKVKCRTSIWSGENDLLVPPKQVALAIPQLTNANVSVFTVADKCFSHMDFVWAKDINKLVYNKVIQEIQEVNALT